MKLPIAALAALATLLPAAARDNGDRTQSRAATRQRFQSLMQPDNTSMSCCGEADAFEAMRSRSRVTITVPFITDGKGMVAPGTGPQSQDEVGCLQPDWPGHSVPAGPVGFGAIRRGNSRTRLPDQVKFGVGGREPGG